MPEQFLHGVEVVELDYGARPISTVRSSVIGLIGTAPDSQPQTTASLNTGTLAANNALTFTSVSAGAIGNQTSIKLRNPQTASAALSVVVNGSAIVVNLATDSGGLVTSTATAVKAAIDAKAEAAALVTVSNTGASNGSGVVAAINSTMFLDGGNDEAFPVNVPVLVAGSRLEAAKLGTAGTLPAAIDAIFDQAGAMVVVVRVEAGIDAAATKSNIIGGVDVATGQYKGVQAFLGAESIVKVQPKILIAPGFSNDMAVVSEMLGIADRLRAVILADGPNTTDQAAIGYREQFGSARVYVVDPWVKVWDTEANAEALQPASARVAGMIARSDNDRGFWWSPSNTEMYGITGTARSVDFTLGDVNARANYLNENEVATIIQKDGYRLWGNRTCAADPKWAFLSVRRTADMINESLLRAHMWAVDRNITKTYVQDVLEGVNSYLRHLTAVGAILGGKAWADPALNTPDQISQGKVYFDFDFTPPYPAEHITFRSRLVNDYIEEIFK
ncbi:phage tail sheath subtilisin-like domain-containing protein [uncultured Azonexus sp.]|uniref:phage tail sheath subtilisin-like domain-containing protein n=1 Tax=uncultured Azonexus sp. TaxID=520307 RepID=UPI002602DB4F|nr:phage tail sheath subtilisin-like domain-containing protein [uncultured Azonexus sp.]